MNIGAICDYSGFWAMRVKEYFVDGALRILGENIYHPSDYAKVTETQWEAELEEILAKNGELIAKLEEASKEALGL